MRKVLILFLIIFFTIYPVNAISLPWNGSFSSGDHWISQTNYYSTPYYRDGAFNACLLRSNSLEMVNDPLGTRGIVGKFNTIWGDRCNTPFNARAMLTKIPYVETEGADRYYSVSLYVPNDYQPQITGEWINFWEIMSNGVEYPYIMLYLKQDNSNYLRFTYGPSAYRQAASLPITINDVRGKWVDFIVRVKWSSTTNGIVEVWYKFGTESTYRLAISNYATRTTDGRDTSEMPFGIYQGMVNNPATPPSRTIYLTGIKVGTTIDQVKYTGSTVYTYPPCITSWYNTKTSSNDLTISVNTSESVTFSYVSNQTLTTKTWNGASTGSQSYTTSWTTTGTKTVTASGSNANGTITNPKTWTITVSALPQPTPTPTGSPTPPPEPTPIQPNNVHSYGIGGNIIDNTNSIRNNTISNKGDGTETIGLLADNCNDGSSDWTNSWACLDGVLTPTSLISRTSSSQYINEYTNISLYLKVNESVNNLWEADIRHLTSRDSIYKGYQMVSQGSSNNLLLQDYTTTWNILSTGSYTTTLNTPAYYIFDLYGNTLNSYVNSSEFSRNNLVVNTTNSVYQNGDYIRLDGSTVTFDDIRLLTYGNYTGDIRIYDTSDSGNTTTQIVVRGCTIGCSLEWRQKLTGDFIILNSSFIGDLYYNIQNNTNTSNEVRIRLLGTSTTFPSFNSVEFVQGSSYISSPSSGNISGSYNFCDSGCNLTWSNYYGLTKNIGTGELFVSNILNDFISKYKFNENYGSITYDQNNTNNNDLTLVNTPAWISPCLYGSCLQFDGADYATNTSTTNISHIYPLSISMWINKSSTNSWDDLFRKNGSWAMQISDTGYLNLEITGITDKMSTISIPLNTWTHVAITWDGTNIKFYKNGILSQTISATNTPNVGTSQIYIGGGAAGFNGKIDELHIFNRVITNDEVNITRDNTQSLSGYIRTNFNAGINNETYSVTIDADNYSVSYANNSSSFASLGSYTGLQIIQLNTKYSNTDLNITIFSGSLRKITYNYRTIQSVNSSISDYINYWNMNQNSGIDLINLNATAVNTGTLNNMNIGLDNGTSGWNSSGKYGNALLFDGTDDFVSINASNFTDITYTFWMKRIGSGNQHIITNLRSTVRASDTLIVYYPNTSVGGVTGSWTPNTNWNYIAISQTGTNCKIYLNATMILNSTTCPITNRASTPSYLGRWDSSFFNGSIDDVKIYNRVLNYSEINESMQLYTSYNFFVPPTPINVRSDFIDTCTPSYYNCYYVAWEPGIGNITDSYNIKINDIWQNGTTNNWIEGVNNQEHITYNISIYAVNNTYINQTPSIYNFTIPNRPVIISSVSNISSFKEGDLLYGQIYAEDFYDQDIITYADDDSNITTNETTGNFFWSIPDNSQGNYTVRFWANDSYGSNVYQDVAIEILDGTPNLFDISDNIYSDSETPPTILSAYISMNGTNIDNYTIIMNGTTYSNISSSSWISSEIQDNTNHTFEVWGYNNNLSQNTTHRFATLNVSVAPWQVLNLTNNTVINTSINLLWDANLESDLNHYDIFVDDVYNKNTTTNSTTIFGLNPNTSYNFIVRAVDNSGNEGQNSSLLPLSTMSEPIYPPSIISNLNNHTSTSVTTITVDVNEYVLFSVGANQSITTWSWTNATKVDGDTTTNSTAYKQFLTPGTTSVLVQGTNTNGSTSTLTWTITVSSNGAGGGTNWDYLSGEVSMNGATITTNPNVGSETGGIYSFGYVFIEGSTYWINTSKTGYISNNTQITFTSDVMTWNPTLIPVNTAGEYVPSTPISCVAVVVNNTFTITTTCEKITSNVTDSMNKTNGISWLNDSSTSLIEYGITPHGWSNVSFYAYNNTGAVMNLTPATLNTQVGNNIPVQSPIGNKWVVVNNTLSFSVSSTDLDGDILVYDTDATKGTTFNPNTGEYTWNTTYSDIGVYNFNFNTTDNQTPPGITSETMSITVSEMYAPSDPINVTSAFRVAQDSLYSLFSSTTSIFSLSLMTLGFGVVLYGFNRQKASLILLGITTIISGFAMLLIGNYIITAIVSALPF